MADAVVSLVVGNLFNLFSKEVTALNGIRGDLELIETKLTEMNAFLRDAEEREANDNLTTVRVQNVRELAYDIEDIVETYFFRVYQRREQGHSFIGILKNYVSLPSHLNLCHSIGMQITDVKDRLSKITLKIRPPNEEPPREEILANERRLSAIEKDSNIVVGFQEDVKNIVKLLLAEHDERSVISIVGMGGAGKTTLSRRVRDHDLIKRSFRENRVLASVSQSYNVTKILREIAGVFIGKEILNHMNETEWKNVLYRTLQNQRYLIILDDIWQPEVWTHIQPYFPDGMNGSRLMITTRFENVAKHADPSVPPYMLRPFTGDESWELFHKIVFRCRDGSTVCTKELEQLGKTIVEGCGGLPLAVAVMAGFVATKPRTLLAWREVQQEVNWNNIPNGQVCMNILSLSYKNLPPPLKPCFLYLSCFPKGHRISAKNIVSLWIAEGLVYSPDVEQGRKTIEDVAKQWLGELNHRCLIEHVEWMYDGGRITEFQVHDLLSDLCRKKARELNFFHTKRQDVEDERPQSGPPRRLVLHPGGDGKGYSISKKIFNPKLRTLHTFFQHSTDHVTQGLPYLQRSKLLRVINLEGADCHKLPKSIGDVLHLRYLGLKRNKLQSIPRTIGNLLNLQTLDVREDDELKTLPKSVWGLSSMRHVLTDDNIEPAVGGRGKIKSVKLQTLSRVKAGGWIKMSLATLKNLTSLGVFQLSVDHHTALVEALDHLHLLCTLFLGGDKLPRKALALPKHQHLVELALFGALVEHSDAGNNDGRPTFKSDELPPNLGLIILEDSKLKQDPFTLLGKLSYLNRLKLSKYVYTGEELECSSDSFPQLKDLVLVDLPSRISRWRWEEGAMPHLDEAAISNCVSLERTVPSQVYICWRNRLPPRPPLRPPMDQAVIFLYDLPQDGCIIS